MMNKGKILKLAKGAWESLLLSSVWGKCSVHAASCCSLGDMVRWATPSL